uniref:Pentapeptide repeat-containing protein n=1 Tax=Desulfobacca acetoxidans TaxID=60893 RepID=A0A7V4G678_9BACT
MSQPKDQGFRPLPEDLRHLLDSHAAWLATGEGVRADLPEYDFQNLDLRGRVLTQAGLPRANFTGASLVGANLEGADLEEATFDQADLWEAAFQDANLQGAHLEHSLNLNTLKLGRANLKDCRLPQDKQQFAGLEAVKEAANVSSQIFTALLVGGVYTFFTVFSMTDVNLVTDSGVTTLPIFNSALNVTSFFLAAPTLLLLTYVYFHLNLQHLWKKLADIPAVFPDGQLLDKKVFPWLFNWLPNSYFKQLRELKDRDHIFVFLQRWSVCIFAWFFIPVILVCIWFRYLYVRNVVITTVHVIIITAAFLFGCWFYRLASDTLRGTYFLSKKRIQLNLIMTVLVASALVIISDGFIQGVPAQLEEELLPQEQGKDEGRWWRNIFYLQRRWVPELLYMWPFHLKIIVNLDEQEISTKTAKGGSAKGNDTKGDGAEGKDLPLARGASLKAKDLRYASAKGAFLARADLRRAQLEGAYLRSADLREAKLGEAGVDADGARLSRAFLFEADLRKACLYHARLAKATLVAARLEEADLERTDFTEANLAGAFLKKAKLKRAVFKDANLQEADLKEVKGVEIHELQQARCWVLAFYDSKLLPKLGLPEDHEAQIRSKNLSLPTARNFSGKDLRNADLSSFDLNFVNFTDADLREAHLNDAKMSGAKLEKAKLQGTSLQGAELWGAEALTKEQVHEANSWVLAFYNEEQLKMLDLPPDHNKRLKEKDLRGYPLQGVNLKEVDLEDFDVAGASLEEADLRGADLRGVKNLTWKQLSSAKYDKNTRLPEYLALTRQ